MTGKKVFYSDRAPGPRGPYSQAVIHKGLLYVSGQIPVDPETGLVVSGSIEKEAAAVLDNLKIIVEEAGSGMNDVLKVTCYLSDLGNFGGFNNVYENYFRQDLPARTTLQSGGLPLGAKIEIDAIAALPVINTDDHR